MNASSSVPSLRKRTVYFDYLRVLATFIVMLLHVSAQNWSTSDVGSGTFAVFSIYNSISRWGVPVFVMISGALFLNRDIPIRRILKHNVLRMITALFGWSFLYFLFAENSVKSQLLSLLQKGKADQLMVIFNSHFHLWFVPMIAGLYLCYPVLKQITKDEKTAKYFLLLCFLFTFFFPEIKSLADNFLLQRYAKLFDSFYGNISRLSMGFAAGFCGYFILGYYLNKIDLSCRQRKILIWLGISGFLSTVLLTLAASWYLQEPVKNYLGNFTVNVMLEAVGIFILFRYLPLPSSGIYPLISRLSKWSFGAYLVHALLIEELDKIFGLNTLSFHPVFSVPLIVLIIFLLSFTISALLNHIPVVNKYLV